MHQKPAPELARATAIRAESSDKRSGRRRSHATGRSSIRNRCACRRAAPAARFRLRSSFPRTSAGRRRRRSPHTRAAPRASGNWSRAHRGQGAEALLTGVEAAPSAPRHEDRGSLRRGAGGRPPRRHLAPEIRLPWSRRISAIYVSTGLDFLCFTSRWKSALGSSAARLRLEPISTSR